MNFKIKSKKQTLLFLLLILCGIGCIFAGNALKTKNAQTTSVESDAVSDIRVKEAALSQELEDFLEQLEGISQVSVLVTLECSDQAVFAKDTTVSGENYVIVNSGGQNHVIQTQTSYAKVRGVAVLCQGGHLSQNQEKIVNLLSALFQIPKSDISVAGKK